MMVRRVAKETNNFDDIDKDYAYAVWIVEKEFNVGPVSEGFLAMKFWNLLDEFNISKYNSSMKGKNNNGGLVNTFG